MIIFSPLYAEDLQELKTDDILIDVGCGKGRVSFFIASKNKIKKVIGIELQKELVNIATNNLSKIKRKTLDVAICHADAAEFDFYEGTVFYLYNPFGINTLKAVLNNISASLITNPRRILFVYLHAGKLERAVIDNENWLISYGKIPNMEAGKIACFKRDINVYLWRNITDVD